MNTLTYPNAPGFKSTGTSSDAAESMKPRTAILRERVLEALVRRPMTADECAKAIGETPFGVRPRFSELQIEGKISDTGIRRKNESGRSANVYRATTLF